MFRVVLTGETEPGLTEAEVRVRLAGLFHVPVQRINPLVRGTTRVVRRGLDQQSATRLCAAMQQAGAVARMEPDPPGLPAVPEATAPAAAPPAPQPPPRRDAEFAGAARPGKPLRSSARRAPTPDGKPGRLLPPNPIGLLRVGRPSSWAWLALAATTTAGLFTWVTWTSAKTGMPGTRPFDIAVLVLGAGAAAVASWRGLRSHELRPVLIGVLCLAACLPTAKTLFIDAPRVRNRVIAEEDSKRQWELRARAYREAAKATPSAAYYATPGPRMLVPVLPGFPTRTPTPPAGSL